MTPPRESRKSENAVTHIERQLARAERRRANNTKTIAVVVMIVVAISVATGVVMLSSPQAEPPQPQAGSVATVSVATAKPVPQVEPEPESKPKETKSTETPEPPDAKPSDKPSASAKEAPKSAVQSVSISIGQQGYEPSIVQVRAGIPIELTVGKGEGCAAGFLMPELNVAADNSQGPATVKLTALEPGSYRFSCGMDMVQGQLVVR